MEPSSKHVLFLLRKVAEQRKRGVPDQKINQFVQQATKKQLGKAYSLDDLNEDASSWGNFFRTMGQGLSFGFGDEAIAGLRSAFTDETYADALAQERAGVEGYRAANPGKAIAAEVAGALPTMFIPGAGQARAASLGGRLGQAALRGTGEGALYGAGVSGTSETAGKDTIADDIRSASQNALMGATGGTVMRAGTEVLGPTLRKGAARLLGTNEAKQTARDIVRDTARMDGSDVVEQRIDDVSPINRQDVRLGDLTEGLQEQTAAANFMGGPGAQIIRPQLKAREAGAGARIDDALTRAMRTQMSFQKYMAFELNDISKYQQLASPMYNDAFDNMTLLPIMDQLKKLAKDPLIASKAVNKAKLLSGLDDFDLGANATPRTWEMIRRGLGDVIGDETDSLTGKTSAVGQRAAALKREITDLMDRPEVDTAGLFKTARNTFADPAALKSAMEKGHKLFRTQDTTKLGYGLADIEQMTRGEKDAVLKGVAYSIKDLLNKDNKAPRIMRQITTGGRADILRALLPDESAYNQFIGKLDDELMMLETSGDILRGSRTEPLRQAIQRVQKQAGGLTAMSPQGFISSLVSRLRDDGEQATRENVTRYMAEMLMTPVADAKKISSILKGNKVDRIYEAVRSVSAAMSEKVGRVTPTIAEQQFQLSPF
tara:strand:- start:2186 stop:4162 length:1977 start_codon:yes stop_codon:yes gene_type:complete